MSIIKDDLSYFHGGISRQEAESKLRSSPSGSYLIRVRSQSPGNYVLSMIHAGQFMHFQLHNHGECWFSIDEGPLFEGLDDMIDHYSTLPDGLPTRLEKSLNRNTIKTAKGASTALHAACLNSVLSKIKNCKDAKMINAVDKYGRTPIHEACRAGSLEGASELFGLATRSKLRVNLTVKDNLGWTALHYAAASGNGELVHQLNSWGCPITALNNDGETPKHVAARFGAVECCLVLSALERGSTISELECVKWPWYHGQITRVAAEHILTMNGTSDGLFLVRKSNSSGRGFVLTLSENNQAFHYQIAADNTGAVIYSIDDGPSFRSLHTLLDYYVTQADGLPCPLKRYCRKKSMLKQEDDIYSPALYASLDEVKQVQASPPASDYVAPSTINNPAQPSSSYEAPSSTGPMMPSRSLKPSRPSVGDPDSDNDADDYNHVDDVLPIPAPHDVGEALIIPGSQMTLSSTLGSGEFGDVKKGIWHSPTGNIEVAVKTLKVSNHGESEFLREASIMTSLNHTNVVKLFGVCKEPRMMVMEFVPKGALESYLEKNYAAKRKYPDSNQVVKWAQQVAAGMLYLEKKRIVHRDLATRNILLTADLEGKISDFGLSRTFSEENDYYTATAGGRWPVKWYAPESIGLGKFSHKSDVWSFGITMWEMYTSAAMPYGDLPGGDVYNMLARGERLKKPKNCPDQVFALMYNCWKFDAVERPSFGNILTRLITLQPGRRK